MLIFTSSFLVLCLLCKVYVAKFGGGGIFLCLISLLNFSFVVKVVYFYDPNMTINGIRLSCSLEHMCKFEYLYTICLCWFCNSASHPDR